MTGWQLLMQVEAPLPPVPPQVIVSGPESLPPQVIVMIVLAALAAATIVLFPLMRAFARRIEGRQQSDVALQADLDELRARVMELEQDRARVLDIEERVDFAERLLTQGQAGRRLEGPAE